MSPEGRFWVMIFPTLGEPGPLEVGEANLEYGVAVGLVLGSEILGSSANSLVGEILILMQIQFQVILDILLVGLVLLPKVFATLTVSYLLLQPWIYLICRALQTI